MSAHGTQRGDKQHTGTCKVLLLLEWLRKGAQGEILSQDPTGSGFLPWQGSRAGQSRCRAAPGQAQAGAVTRDVAEFLLWPT